jgi:hypothetical protein
MNYRTKPKSKKRYQFSSEEVAEAVRKFRENGGLVKKLPDERVPVNNSVGKKYMVYETLESINS